jgi:hypothetical protein
MYAKPELTLVGTATGVILGGQLAQPILDDENSTVFDTRPEEE